MSGQCWGLWEAAPRLERPSVLKLALGGAIFHMIWDCIYSLLQSCEVGGVTPVFGMRRLRPREVPWLVKVTQPEAAQLHIHSLCLSFTSAVCTSFSLHPHFAFGQTVAQKIIQQLDPELGEEVSSLGPRGNGHTLHSEVAFRMPLIQSQGRRSRERCVMRACGCDLGREEGAVSGIPLGTDARAMGFCGIWDRQAFYKKIFPKLSHPTVGKQSLNGKETAVLHVHKMVSWRSGPFI